jgi:NAD(P)H-flavin reductase
MRETQALIERVRRISSEWQHLELAIEVELTHIQPGQTLLARLGDSFEPYIREQWIPLGFNPDEGVLIVERPLSRHYLPGDAVQLIGPVGSAFPLSRNIKNLLLVAMDYPPTRLLSLMLQAIAEGMSVVLVLTGKAQDYPLSTLPSAVEIVHSPTIQSWDTQEHTTSWAEQMFVVASPVYAEIYYRELLNTTAEIRRALPQSFLHGIYALPLPCGTGACMGCMVRRKGKDQFVCLNGPAFDLSKMNF